MKVFFDDSGFSFSDYESTLEKFKPNSLLTKKEMPFLELPKEEELLKISVVSDNLREKADTLVVVGMGGSSRGAKAVHQAVGRERGNLLFIDNIDPNLIDETLKKIDWKRTAFAFISKSGRTLETVTAMNVIIEELKRRNLTKGRLVFVGDRGNSFEEISREFDAPFLEIPKEVGGRFSVFTAVGLLPLMFASYDIVKFLDGAYDSINAPISAFYLAASKYLHYQKGRNISVVMPYSSYMSEFTEWYAQLWAESLGKLGKGQTPLKAIGTSSQHSILQLFIDGPDDKFYQLFFVNSYPVDLELPEKTYVLPYLSKKKISEVMRAEFEGTLFALKRSKRPIVRFELSSLSEYQMGYLLMFYMISVVVMAKLLGINPYGQPAVEIGKKYASEILMGRGGDV
ncbi:glucose-6-phosphate isomerase [Balnearium lithotrophicum]|uniref:Glucose-6-phosphate isomerase n=1 Tax=Balnearium lithotrophicum TaxID=223788 RepID=A0A521BNQ3_9BACT|nr:glucose-6-phosphate isomerase [Balnearium lithotrophicum]SMO48752.1 glucose-6-phosphate isomerase [Balnearium lithotrophicum]